jgi:hypothetical protein
VRVLIDECVPWKLGSYLIGHECESVSKVGFAGKKNGVLLTLAEQAGFDAFLTVDQGIPYQQRLEGLRIALSSYGHQPIKMEALLPHVPACLEALRSVLPGDVVLVG